MDKLRIFDPTVQPKVEEISYAPRPRTMSGLRIGLVENTKFNSDRLLLKIADILEKEYGAACHMIRSKFNASVPAHEEILVELATQCDAVVAGIGD
jgi:hypothetical protein